MTEATPNADSLEQRVRDAIESMRPAIQSHGGDIDFVGIEDQIAQVRLTGACSGCPHAAETLQNGVERHLREQVPEIQGVVNVA